jgi:hypothetical protein
MMGIVLSLGAITLELFAISLALWRITDCLAEIRNVLDREDVRIECKPDLSEHIDERLM